MTELSYVSYFFFKKILTSDFSKVFETDMKGTEQFLEKMIDHVELSSTGTLNFAEFLVLMVKSQGEPIF